MKVLNLGPQTRKMSVIGEFIYQPITNVRCITEYMTDILFYWILTESKLYNVENVLFWQIYLIFRDNLINLNFSTKCED